MASWISPDGSYHLGDEQPGDIAVPERPDATHVWVSGAWQPDPVAVKAAHNAPILAQITALDVFVPRGLEDTWTALGFDTTKLPAIQQTRLTQKIALRAQLQV
ncbi:MAG TPA: hypothetical protein VK558_07610 [Patescibacteria group bacterium]|nr:hypothetical protein [Patescibacteria group bacterium]